MNKTSTRVISKPVMNEFKNMVATAFLHAINATVGYRLMEAGRPFDNLGIDFKVNCFGMGRNRLEYSDESEINIQLKGVAISSSSMFDEDDDEIRYNLGAIQPVATHYVIVVVMPPDEDLAKWIEINPTEVILKCRSYFYLLEEAHKGGEIVIPKSDQLTPKTYKDLFNVTSERL